MHSKRGKSKKAIQLSFNFIFSLIVAALVIFVGIWAIKQFLTIKDRTTIQAGLKDIEDVVQEVWQSTEARRTESFFLPSTVRHICFVNKSRPYAGLQGGIKQELEKWGNKHYFDEGNVFVLPYEVKIKYNIQGYKDIKCGDVDCLNILQTICCINKGGKVRITFTKEEGKVSVDCA